LASWACYTRPETSSFQWTEFWGGLQTDDKHIDFTIGETEKGKAAGLNETIETIISEAGLPLHQEPSSNGTRIYTGFDLNAVSDHELRAILRRVYAAIESIA